MSIGNCCATLAQIYMPGPGDEKCEQIMTTTLMGPANAPALSRSLGFGFGSVRALGNRVIWWKIHARRVFYRLATPRKIGGALAKLLCAMGVQGRHPQGRNLARYRARASKLRSRAICIWDLLK